MTPFEPFIGNRIKAQTHLLEAYAGYNAISEVYNDEYGAWISSASPIRNAAGEVIGILQADKELSELNQLWALKLSAMGIKIAIIPGGVGPLVLRTIGRLQKSNSLLFGKSWITAPAISVNLLNPCPSAGLS